MTDFADLGINVETGNLTRGQRELRNLVAAGEQAEERLTGGARRINAAWSGMARAAGIAGAAVAAAFSAQAIISGIAGFETSMSRVQAISGATASELADLRDVALELGGTTEFSASQAADALGFLSMAGFSASESMAAIPSVLDLATASGMGLAQSADIASNVLSGFGLAATDAGRAADVLAAASSTTNTNVEQLGSAMSTAAPISAALGISMEETAAAIGVMSDAGIQGERAGTALRGVFASLAGPTTQAQEALARYGLTAADVDPQTQGLANVLDTLRQRGISTADAMTIFGREAASGALVMIDTSQRVRDLTGQFQAAQGAATAMASTMRDNLGGDLAGLRSAVEGLVIAIGDAGLTSVLRTATQAFTAIVRVVSENVEPAFDAALVVMTALAATQIPALIAGIAGLPAVFLAAGGAAGVFSTALGVLSGIVTVLGGPVSVLLGLIAGGAAAVYLFRDRITELVAPIDDVRQAQNTLNGAMAVFHESAAPSAAAAAIDAANAYKEQATAARDAARSELARVDAMIAAQGALDPESSLFLGGLRSEAVVALDRAQRALTEANAAANEAARRVTGTMSERMTSAADAARTVTVEVEGLGIALANLNLPGTGAGGQSGEGALSVLQSLLGTGDPRAEIEAWYLEAMTALQDAQLIERGMLEEHNAYRLRIEQSYQDQLRALRLSQSDEQLGHYQSFFGDMASALETGGDRLLGISRAFGLAEAAISMWRGAAKALELPFPASLAAWAQVLKTGASALSGIRSARPGNVASGAASAASAASAPPSQPLQAFLNIQGPLAQMFAGALSPLLDGLAKEAGDRGYILLTRAS